MAEPNRETPKTDTADPIRAKLRIDSVEPRCKKSKTEADVPNFSDDVAP